MTECLEHFAGGIFAGSRVGDVTRKSTMLGTQLSRGELRRITVEIEDGDLGTMRREQPCRRESDATRIGCARDDGDLAGQKHLFLPDPDPCADENPSLAKARKRVIYTF